MPHDCGAAQLHARGPCPFQAVPTSDPGTVPAPHERDAGSSIRSGGSVLKIRSLTTESVGTLVVLVGLTYVFIHDPVDTLRTALVTGAGWGALLALRLLRHCRNAHERTPRDD